MKAYHLAVYYDGELGLFSFDDHSSMLQHLRLEIAGVCDEDFDPLTIHSVSQAQDWADENEVYLQFRLAGTENPTLKPWDEEDTTPPLEYELTVEDDRVDFVAENGMSVWIEWQEGRVQVHCFRPGRDEPVNIKIKEDEIEIDNFDYQMGGS